MCLYIYVYISCIIIIIIIIIGSSSNNNNSTTIVMSSSSMELDQAPRNQHEQYTMHMNKHILIHDHMYLYKHTNITISNMSY